MNKNKNKIIVPLNAENKKRNSNSIINIRNLFVIILFPFAIALLFSTIALLFSAIIPEQSKEEILRRQVEREAKELKEKESIREAERAEREIALEKCRKEIERNDSLNSIGRDEWNASFKKNQSILEERKLVKSFTWRTAWPGNLAVANIAFKNKSSVDISNIIVVFKFYGESGGLLREIRKFIPIVLKAGKMRTIRDITVGFIPDFSTNMSCEILE